MPNVAQAFARDCPLPVLTFDSRVLTHQHFGRFWSDCVVIRGIEDGSELYRVIREDETELDTDKALSDVILNVGRLLDEHPSSQALVLECTNLPPYRQAIENRYSLPVFDIFTALEKAAPPNTPIRRVISAKQSS